MRPSPTLDSSGEKFLCPTTLRDIWLPGPAQRGFANLDRQAPGSLAADKVAILPALRRRQENRHCYTSGFHQEGPFDRLPLPREWARYSGIPSSLIPTDPWSLSPKENTFRSLLFCRAPQGIPF